MAVIQGVKTIVKAEAVSAMLPGNHKAGGDSWNGYHYKDGVKVFLNSGEELYAWEEDGALLLANYMKWVKENDILIDGPNHE